MFNYPAIILIVLTVIFAYKKDYDKGFYCSLFFLLLCPNYITIDINISLPSITIHRIIIAIMLLKFILNKDKTNQFSFREIPFIKIFCLISLSLLISSVSSDYKLITIKRFGYFFVESFLLYIIIARSITSGEKVVKMLKVINLALLFVALIGLLEKYAGLHVSEFFAAKQKYDVERADLTSSIIRGDITSTLLHRILFGYGMAIGMVNGLVLLDQVEGKKKKYFYWFSILCFAAGLYLGLSRGPWLGFIFASLFIVVLFYKPYFKRVMMIFIFVLTLFLLRPGTLNTINALYKSTFEESSIKGASFEWRFIVLNHSINSMISSGSFIKVLFGNGDGGHIFHDFEPVLLPTGHWHYIESWDMDFAVLLYDRGFLGLLLFFILYIIFFWKGLRYYMYRKKYWREALLTLAVILLFVFMKTNVRIFASQLITLELIYIALGGLIQNEKIL